MSHVKNKIIIELWGAPGVGKTTLAEKLVSDYGYVRIVPREKKFKHFLLFSKYPITILAWLILILKDFLRIKDQVIFWYNVSLLFSAVQRIDDARKSPESKVVLDEGLVQRFLSYSDTVHERWVVKWLLRLSPIGNIVILVNDREVNSDRYEDTTHVRSQRGAEYISMWKENILSNTSIVSDSYKYLKKPNFFATKDRPIDVIIREINE